MKKIHFLTLLLISCFTSKLKAQVQQPNCAILNIRYTGYSNQQSSQLLGNLTRREFSKLDVYQILYAEDIKPLIKTDEGEPKPFDCYSKQCLVRLGKKIESDKMLSGQVEHLRDAIIISFRIINVKTNRIENSITKEFLNLEDQMKNMVIITLREMMGLENDKDLEKLLVKKFSRENYINNQGVNSLNLSGTRIGTAALIGSNRDIIRLPESEGGFDATPIFFNFGYQFEKQYLNQGRLQGLFEFIPSITGLEQGLFIPSLSILHGIRDNKTGFEFAFGPSIGVIQTAQGFFNENNEWRLASEFQAPENPDGSISSEENPFPIVTRLDSRGDFKLTAGFLLGVGFSLKSGDINIPVNLFSVFQKDALRVGISFGINNSRRKN